MALNLIVARGLLRLGLSVSGDMDTYSVDEFGIVALMLS
jgi:hypothetical protein